MKYPINYLTKEEQSKILQNYKKTPEGKAQLARLTRLIITGLLSIALAIYILITNYQANSAWYAYPMPIMLLIFGIVFIIASYILKKKSLNNYYQKHKRSSLE